MADKFEKYRLTKLRDKALTANRVNILEHLLQLHKILEILRSKDVLTEDMQEEIMYERTNQMKISKLLDIIPRRGNPGFEKFLMALVSTDQDDIALLLDEHYAAGLIKERNRSRGGGDVSSDEDDHEKPDSKSSKLASHSQETSNNFQFQQPVFDQSKCNQQGMPDAASYQTPMIAGTQLYNVNTGQTISYPFDTDQPVIPSYQSEQLMPITTVTNPSLPSSPINVKNTNQTSPGTTPSGLHKDAEDDIDVGISKLATTNDSDNVRQNSPLDCKVSAIIDAMVKELPESEQPIVRTFLKSVYFNEEMHLEVQKVADLKALSAKIAVEKDAHVYRIRNPRAGYAVLINNKYFLSSHKPRDGAECDSSNLRHLFSKLQFDIHEPLNDLTAEEIITALSKLAKSGHLKKYDVLVVFVMSHGIQGEVYGQDGKTVKIDTIVDIFSGKNCVDMSNKPKLFFVQACQGSLKSVYQPDSAGEEETELVGGVSAKSIDKALREKDNYKIRIEAEKSNVLIAYAAVRGYKAWRFPNLGSLFVRTLVYVFSNYAHERDVQSMLTKVNYYLMYLKTRGDSNEVIELTSQFESTLRKDLFLYPGYDGKQFEQNT